MNEYKSLNENQYTIKSLLDFNTDYSNYINLPTSGSTLLNFFKTSEKSGELLKLENEIRDLETKLSETISKGKKSEEEKQAIEQNFNELKQKYNLKNIVSRVLPNAEKKILKEKDFAIKFQPGSKCKAVVISIDIRQSTQLMLNANSNELYSQFISEFCIGLSHIIRQNYGIFDKFTGDGILAFFPDFYSGEDALLYAIKSAFDAHNLFKTHYAAKRDHFDIIRSDIGLGIGIDYGEVTITTIFDGLTVVGKPVVFACRLSSAPSGITLLNQGAYNLVNKSYSSFIETSEYELEIKHGDKVLCYKVENISYKKSNKPDWDN